MASGPTWMEADREAATGVRAVSGRGPVVPACARPSPARSPHTCTPGRSDHIPISARLPGSRPLSTPMRWPAVLATPQENKGAAAKGRSRYHRTSATSSRIGIGTPKPGRADHRNHPTSRYDALISMVATRPPSRSKIGPVGSGRAVPRTMWSSSGL